MGRMGTPEEVVCGMVFLALDESSYVAGSEVAINGDELSGQGRLADTTYDIQGNWKGSVVSSARTHTANPLAGGNPEVRRW